MSAPGSSTVAIPGGMSDAEGAEHMHVLQSRLREFWVEQMQEVRW
jgi:hypothetical protein